MVKRLFPARSTTPPTSIVDELAALHVRAEDEKAGHEGEIAILEEQLETTKTAHTATERIVAHLKVLLHGEDA